MHAHDEVAAQHTTGPSPHCCSQMIMEAARVARVMVSRRTQIFFRSTLSRWTSSYWPTRKPRRPQALVGGLALGDHFLIWAESRQSLDAVGPGVGCGRFQDLPNYRE